MSHLKAGFGPQVNGLIGSQGELRWQIAIQFCLMQAGCCAANEAGLASAGIKSDFAVIIPSTAPLGQPDPIHQTVPSQHGQERLWHWYPVGTQGCVCSPSPDAAGSTGLLETAFVQPK